jgi:hypothetical protein
MTLVLGSSATSKKMISKICKEYCPHTTWNESHLFCIWIKVTFFLRTVSTESNKQNLCRTAGW